MLMRRESPESKTFYLIKQNYIKTIKEELDMEKFKLLRAKVENKIMLPREHTPIFNTKKKGDIAFEYVIILVIMAGVIFVGWNMLGDTVMEQITKISETLSQQGNDNITPNKFG